MAVNNLVIEVEFVDIMGSIQRNAQAIDKLSAGILATYNEFSKEEYAIFVDKMSGYMNRITALFDGDLNGKFSEMTEKENY